MAETRTPIISFKNFSFQYRAQKQPTLHDINLDIYPGERVLIAGPSGSGKSTLAACINGLNPFSYPGKCTGTLTVDGVDAPHSSIFELAGHVGTVLQDPDGQFIGLTVGEDIAFALENSCTPQDEMHEITRRAAGLVGIENHLDYAPHELSGGQKQRVSLAGVMVDEVKILLFDEPLANLDRKGAAFLMASLRTLTESGYAVLLVEHRLEQVLPFAHEVWRLRNGTLERQTGRESLYATQPEAAEPVPTEARREEPVMTLRGVGWRAGGRSILEGVDLNIFRGERLLLLGDNGCGKTSLLRLMARLARPTAGEIRQFIDPALGQRRGSRAWFRRVGVVYQNPNCQLFMPTVAQEVAFAAKSEGFAREIMELFDIMHLSERHPHSLSEGQKRRVSIAAVAASQPELLLLDEPTVGQDGEGLRTLLHALNHLHTRTGSTIVTVTHDRRCAGALCDRVAWLREGRIEKTGGPELIEAAWGDLATL